MSPAVLQAIESLAESPTLLVASDFDGVLAPIVAVPSEARIDSAAAEALVRLAARPRTHVGIVSGRDLADLRARVPKHRAIMLAGSHGAEMEFAPTLTLTPAQADALRAVESAARAIAGSSAGALVEHKPASVAFHYRACDAGTARAVLGSLDKAAASIPGLTRRDGHMVVEFAVVGINKGHALLAMIERVGAAAVFFVGDDVTDEDGFRAIADRGVTVKVGPGATQAAHRVEDQRSAVRLLQRLADARAAGAP